MGIFDKSFASLVNKQMSRTTIFTDRLLKYRNSISDLLCNYNPQSKQFINELMKSYPCPQLYKLAAFKV